MSHLADLKTAQSLHSLAPLLGYKAKGLAYLIHGIADNAKYHDFQIPKRSGGLRTISAPIPELKTLQKRLAQLLEKCITEIETSRGSKDTLSHGFRSKHSIMTNADAHRRRRYVFNIDLHDFFGTINFGRILGFFEKNQYFKLNPTISRTLAQIACHNTVLPQGSPCSPVISNLIGHILDIRMMQLAAKVGCHYSRYADDLTFSTNLKDFPSLIAIKTGDTTQWLPGRKLIRAIRDCGFQLNPAKTRMQLKNFRQDVTGIIVNSKLNVRAEYARNARAMVHFLITKGEFQIKKIVRDDKGAWLVKDEKGTDTQLRGILSFIDSVRHFEQMKSAPIKKETMHFRPPHQDVKEMDGCARVYRRFLLFTQFFRPDQPLLICEGKTDNIYIRCALLQLATKYPTLATVNGLEIKPNLNLFSYTKTTDRILHLGGGTGDISNFIGKYGNEFKGFQTKATRNPVIVLVDNDSGSEKIFATIKLATKSKTPIDGNKPYYFIRDNLYVIVIPKLAGKPTTIEHFFDDSVLKTKLNGKVFSGKDQFDPHTQYGKHLFSEHVIKKERKKIDFSHFNVLLQRISDVLAVHSGKP